jgi:hypothetical protein
MGFPNKEVPPKIHLNKIVQKYANEYLRNMPVLTRKNFDKLKEKRNSFTITGIPKTGIMRQLLNAIQGTLSKGSEDQAWDRYYSQAIKILEDADLIPYLKGNVLKVLAVSFRMARQRAYVQGSWQYAQDLQKKGQLHGLQYHTRDDSEVRWNHKKMDEVVQPMNSDFWEEWLPLNGFNCRCWVEPITKAQFIEDPEKYAYTKNIPKVKPDRGFGL